MRTLTTPRIRMPCSHFHLPNHRCMRCGICAREVGKWKEAIQTQCGARQSAEEAIKAEFSSGFSNIYYVFPFRCSTTVRLSHLPAPASSFLLSSLLLLTPAAASWQKCESFSRIRSRARVILFILPAPSSTTFSPRDLCLGIMDVPCVVNGSIVEALRSHPPLPSLTCPLRKDVLVRYRLGRGIPSLSLLSFVGDLLLRALAMESDPCCWSEISFLR